MGGHGRIKESGELGKVYKMKKKYLKKIVEAMWAKEVVPQRSKKNKN